MRDLTFHKGGIHPPQEKYTDADQIIAVELPMQVTIPLSQHIGAPANPIVAKGDKVIRGQKIAEAASKISATIHASISGTVTSIAPAMLATGVQAQSIIIKADEADHAADIARIKERPIVSDWRVLSSADIINKIADAGIVGMGGATFPTPVKLSVPPGCKAEVLIINAAECEPYLTCDDALMRAHAPEIIEGIEILLKASHAPKALIGIEDNKPEAYEALTKAARGHKAIEVRPLVTKYPQGGEKQLIEALTGREVPSGGLPIHVGAIVQNVATAYAVYQAVVLGQPLIERVVTIVGKGNYLVPIGMAIDSICDSVDSAKEADVVIGGPMMGRSAITLDAPVTKGTSGVTPLPPLPYDPQPCIRCGACIEACPMGLEPYLIAAYARNGYTAEAKDAGAMDCIDCGSCSYSCPSARPIVDYIRLAKGMIRKMK